MIADKILDEDKLATALHEAINSKSYVKGEIMEMGSRILRSESIFASLP